METINKETLDTIESMINGSEEDLKLAIGVLRNTKIEDKELRKRKINLKIAAEMILKGNLPYIFPNSEIKIIVNKYQKEKGIDNFSYFTKSYKNNKFWYSSNIK